MTGNSILRALSSGRFMLAASQQEFMFSIADKYLSNTLPQDFFKKQQLPSVLSSQQAYLQNQDAELVGPVITSDGTFIMPIIGTIFKDDTCYSAGTQTMRMWLSDANADTAVQNIVLYINSGGGEALGTWELAQDIANTTKPKKTYIDGYCCSAAYYFGSATDEIISSSPDNIVGSIGVAQQFRSFTKRYEKEGIISKYYYATTSPLKHGGHKGLEDGDPSHLQEYELDPLDNTFMSFVKEHRPDISQQALDGLEVVASKSLEINAGLIDRIDTFNNVLNSFKSQKTTQSNMKKTYLLSTENGFLLGAIKGVMATGSETSLEEYTPDAQTAAVQAQLETRTSELSTANTKIGEQSLAIANQKTEIETLNSTVASLNTAKQELETEKTTAANTIAELKTKLASYESPEGVAPVTPTDAVVAVVDTPKNIVAYKRKPENEAKAKALGSVF